MHNSITLLQNRQGDHIEKHEDIEEELLTHFRRVHQETEADRQPAIEKIIKIIPTIISKEHNQILLRPISLQEVETAMRQLKVGKAPRPDSFTSDFFHNFWDLIKEEVWQVVESKVNRWMLSSLNATFIALIPKEENSQTLDKF